MRDIGAILWVAIVLIGVVSSIVSNARKQAARSAVTQRQPSAPSPTGTRAVAVPVRPRAFAGSARPHAVQPVRAQAPVVRPQSEPVQPRLDSVQIFQPPPPPGRPLNRLFADRRSLARAVVAAEVLGPPLSLRAQN